MICWDLRENRKRWWKVRRTNQPAAPMSTSAFPVLSWAAEYPKPWHDIGKLPETLKAAEPFEKSVAVLELRQPMNQYRLTSRQNRVASMQNTTSRKALNYILKLKAHKAKKQHASADPSPCRGLARDRWGVYSVPQPAQHCIASDAIRHAMSGFGPGAVGRLSQ
jgi:hypothetical protein